MSDKNITVNVEYYAILREQRGCRSEQIESSPVTAGELYDKLKEKYAFTLTQDTLRVAINHDFRDWDCTLGNNDTVVFIPPVAGG